MAGESGMAKSSKKESPSPAYRAPGTTEWRDLSAPEGDEDQAKLAKKNLSDLGEVLLTSLQMQNLIVLAGSGCGLPPVL
jgi:hypothetical protein